VLVATPDRLRCAFARPQAPAARRVDPPGAPDRAPISVPACELTVSSSTSSVPPGLQPLGETPSLRRYVAELWERREFAWAMATGELRSQHMDTALGNVWHLLNPVLLVAVYYLVFDVVLGVSRGVDHFIEFLAIGVLSYQWAQRSITSGAESITKNEGLIRSLQFPRALLPLGTIIKETLAFLPGVVLMLLVVIPREGITPMWALIVPAFVIQVAFNLGAAMFLARVADRFRDTVNLLPFFFRLVFYGSGVIYAVDTRFFDIFAANPWVTWFFVFNPFYAQLSLWRESLMTSQEIQYIEWMWVTAPVWAVVMLVLGVLVFRGGEKEYGRG
jgi:teichoic acid transport system permease protein